MSNNKISLYKFKPFHFTVLKKNHDPLLRPLARSGHRVVCNDAYLFSYGGFNPATSVRDATGTRLSSAMRELWKYCFDLGEWKRISCKNVPQELASSSVTLSGNIIIIYGGTGVPFGAFCSNRMYLGNLANEFKEIGMEFEELQVSGEVPMPLYGQGVVMDSKYIYSIGGTSGYEYEMDVHRLDLSTKKWELLHKSRGLVHEPEPRYRHEVVFYKGRIYIFGGGRGGSLNIYYGFSKIHVFDVTTKEWEFLPAKHDHRVPRPGYPDNRSCHSCVQCPDKKNLVYICGGFDGFRSFRDVWRFNLDTLQWEKLTRCTMPKPVYFHSTAVTPSGRMCCYGGIVSDQADGSGGRSNDITSAWITIPKLRVICWEAMIFYFKEQMFETSDHDLKQIGLPQEFYERIIDGRRNHSLATT
ncbi:kelch domain-containing protein 10-like isoform X3 [Adelges cooleyi]|uniref:kelch domain-containing protein 10-like isoform X3 n=1 Tax=Adelges cooleyi TaxID=133065 RepID=UPI0021804409|nr:kelch domain-containing protein 10-like isoform X3 [Adelges cooleyi]